MSNGPFSSFIEPNLSSLPVALTSLSCRVIHAGNVVALPRPIGLTVDDGGAVGSSLNVSLAAVVAVEVSGGSSPSYSPTNAYPLKVALLFDVPPPLLPLSIKDPGSIALLIPIFDANDRPNIELAPPVPSTFSSLLPPC
jgi:hypothetical protein